MLPRGTTCSAFAHYQQNISKKVIYRPAILFSNVLILLFIINKLSISFATSATFYPH
ncbi:hypothetical protein CSC12_1384 [Klebsiella michiganensis]|nr:hypothetical protein CSC12_1384 [Klebsiella michiganensis]